MENASAVNLLFMCGRNFRHDGHIDAASRNADLAVRARLLRYGIDHATSKIRGGLSLLFSYLGYETAG